MGGWKMSLEKGLSERTKSKKFNNWKERGFKEVRVNLGFKYCLSSLNSFFVEEGS